MYLIGRKREQHILEDCLSSPRPEFLVVYGRRRVGKTYLIREYFNYQFAFYASGLAKGKTAQQLNAFHDSLLGYGDDSQKAPSDWFEAFRRLRELLTKEDVRRDPVSGKIVVFLDELPWMDTARSDFRAALEYFWNTWGSAVPDLLLIVCGSATSWIIRHLLRDTGGFYNRVTRKIHLPPFSLLECEKLFSMNGMVVTRQQVLESYMVFGGIPYYLNAFDRRLSPAQNIEELCFKQTGQLYYEHEELLGSLFKNYEKHAAVLDALARTKSGTTRTELAKIKEIGDGEPLTKVLNELEQCDFIRKYKTHENQKNGCLYQVCDPFTLFALRHMKGRTITSWLSYIKTGSYYAWCGNAFELVCLLHVPQIKNALGIRSVMSLEYAWHSFRPADGTGGAQIDLVIDRSDGIINLCEMKYTKDPLVIDAVVLKNLLHKLEVFRTQTAAEKALHLTMVCSEGLLRNAYAGDIQQIITKDDLFTDP